MKERNATENELHPKHPVRNFFYFLYTLLAAFAFCALFYAWEKGEALFAALAAAVVILSFWIGIVKAAFFKKP